MSNDINQILIGSVVRKAIADAQNSPGRSVRNLVDAGVNFAKGTFQKRFLEEVQEILHWLHSQGGGQKDHSAIAQYYEHLTGMKIGR